MDLCLGYEPSEARYKSDSASLRVYSPNDPPLRPRARLPSNCVCAFTLSPDLPFRSWLAGSISVSPCSSEALERDATPLSCCHWPEYGLLSHPMNLLLFALPRSDVKSDVVACVTYCQLLLVLQKPFPPARMSLIEHVATQIDTPITKGSFSRALSTIFYDANRSAHVPPLTNHV